MKNGWSLKQALLAYKLGVNMGASGCNGADSYEKREKDMTDNVVRIAKQQGVNESVIKEALLNL